jgi:hypothetical protein
MSFRCFDPRNRVQAGRCAVLTITIPKPASFSEAVPAWDFQKFRRAFQKSHTPSEISFSTSTRRFSRHGRACPGYDWVLPQITLNVWRRG